MISKSERELNIALTRPEADDRPPPADRGFNRATTSRLSDALASQKKAERGRFVRRKATWTRLATASSDMMEECGSEKEDPGTPPEAKHAENSAPTNVCCWKQAHVIDPRNSRWLHHWDIVYAVQLATISFVWPYESAFLTPQFDAMFVVNSLFDASLVVDMVLQLCVAQPDPMRPERVIKSPRVILKNYLKGWFFIDFLSVLPVDFIYLLLRETKGAGRKYFVSMRSLRLLRVVRLMRLMRFVQLLDRWNTSFGISYASLALIKLIGTLAVCCHWMACLWGSLALNKGDELTWLTALRTAKGGPDFPESDTFSLYSLALYWAMVTITSVGYGDVTPQTMMEYRISTGCIAVMAGLWAYIIGAVCGIVSSYDQHEKGFKKNMDDLNWFMAEKDMPSSMRARLRRYFYEAKQMNKEKVGKEVVTLMSPLLQGEVSMFMHRRWISKVWYLRDMNRNIIVWAARNLSLIVLAPNEEVLDDRTLYILQHGLAAHRGRILSSGDVWGEDMLLSNPYLRDKSKARALTHLSVLVLHIGDLVEVISCFPEARARLRFAQIQIAVMRGVIRIARKVKQLRRRLGIEPWEMTEEQKDQFYVDVLQGQTGDDEDEEEAISSRARVEDTVLRAVSLNQDPFGMEHDDEVDSGALSPPTRPALKEPAPVDRVAERVSGFKRSTMRASMRVSAMVTPGASPSRKTAGSSDSLTDLKIFNISKDVEEIKSMMQKSCFMQSSAQAANSFKSDFPHISEEWAESEKEEEPPPKDDETDEPQSNSMWSRLRRL